MFIRKRQKRLAANSVIRAGSCVGVETRPCGLEAACRPMNDTHFTCICPQDNSEPTEDLKCPKRKTVPIAPKPFVNLSINSKNEQNKTPQLIMKNATVQPITGAPAFNQTTSFFPDKYLEFDVMGIVLRINVLMMLTVSMAIFTSIILCVIVLCWRKRSRCCCRRKKNNNYPVVALTKDMIKGECFALNPIYSSPSADVFTKKETLMIPYLNKKNVTCLVEIGQGYFGKVFKGMLKIKEGKSERVAVKMLKDHTNKEAKEDFLREIEIMTYFKHHNILTLIGVCPEDENSSPWMVFEYMNYGDLTELLRNSNEQFTVSSPRLPILDRNDLLVISMQIAAGMRYLASQRFVHRDLACRNCLVGKHLTVKIADFGMSRDIYTSDYYKVGGNRLLPVRWMSPESVVYGKFTLDSDVWSFGVVLWEIYSLGKQPYFGFSNDEVLKLIHDGVLLELPLNCPPVICVLMNGCWKSDPKERLRFIEIHERLKNLNKQPELDSPLPRPPALPAIVDHLTLRKLPPVEPAAVDLPEDSDNYLKPDEPEQNADDHPQPDESEQNADKYLQPDESGQNADKYLQPNVSQQDPNADYVTPLPY